MKRSLTLLAVLLPLVPALSQPATQANRSEDNPWSERAHAAKGPARPWLKPGKFRAFALNHGALQRSIAHAPKESSPEARNAHATLSLPMPDGTFARFRIVESPVMEPELAAKFPELRTYSGQGLDEPTATVRFDTSPTGLHALVVSARGVVFVDPMTETDPDLYASVRREDLPSEGGALRCETQPGNPVPGIGLAAFEPAAVNPAVVLRTYRLAVAARGEYTQFHGGTVAGAMAALVTTVNRVNSIYERDLAVRLVLVANEDRIIYLDPLTDPYPNLTNSIATDQNQANLDAVIGSANYDVGHVVNRRTLPGGIAWVGSVCDPLNKARGSTSVAYPSGPAFDVDFFGHELGHQFGAGHTYNGTNHFCTLDQYWSPAAFEPGSGSTIMSYVASCGSDDLQTIGSPFFHSGSYAEILNYITTGTGASCPQTLITDNRTPTVTAGPNYTIPKGTPFTLTATGSDPDGDTLTYSWEELDLGPPQPLTGPGSADNGSSPLFRVFDPTTNAARTFPKLEALLSHTPSHGEQLPSTQRVLHFRVTARDNHAGGSGVSFADMQLNVVTNAGPFVVTSPNSAVTWTGAQHITWDVAGTTNTSVRATNVNILLSLDGGHTFPVTLASNTPNDGDELVVLPDARTTQARVKVEAVGNVFFAISDQDFTIAGPVKLASSSLQTESCPLGNGAPDPGETITVNVSLQNIGAFSRTNLLVALLATNSVLSPSAPQNVALLPAGGITTNGFGLTVAPTVPCGTTLNALLQLRDDTGDLGMVGFSLPVGRTTIEGFSAANSSVIRPARWSVDSPYPSAIAVSNVPGVLSKVTVTLSNLTEFVPDVVDAMLVNPAGQSVMLMSDLPFGYGTQPMPTTTLTFDDAAAFFLGDVFPIVSGSYRTIDNDFYPGHLLPPAPPGPTAVSLSALAGSNPNGTWRLFIGEHFPFPTNNSRIAGGWSLTLFTSNTVCCVANDLLSLTLEDRPDPATIGEPLTYTLTVSNRSDLAATGVTLSNALPPGVTHLSFVPTQGACAQAEGVVMCDLGTMASGATAQVVVLATPTTVGTLTNRASVWAAQADGYSINNSATALTTVDSLPTLAIDDFSVAEGDTGVTNAIFRVLLTSVASLPVTVHFATSNGTATAGSDYVATSGTLTFAPGEVSKTILVPILGDSTPEPDETFFVVLSDPANAVLGRALGIGVIVDDDPTISIADALPIAEGNVGTKSAIFGVTLSQPISKTVSVRFATSNGTAIAGTDYTPQSGLLNFLPGSTHTNILVTVGGDTAIESDETFFVTLFNPTNASLGAKSQALGTILNDDGLPGVVHHFAWSSLAATQYAGLLFPATLTALDAANTPVDSFHGPAMLAAYGSNEDRTIGTPSGAWTFPMQSANHDARLQSIYLASEMGPACLITALALDVTVLPGQTLSNWTVRLKHTAQTNYAVNAWEDFGPATMHQTDLSLTTTGWVTFPLATPFEYNGTSNVMVDFSFNNASGSTAGQCLYRSVTGPIRSFFAQANSTWGDPVAWSGTNAPVPSATVRIPIVRFTANSPATIAPGVLGNFVNGVWSGELFVPDASPSLVLRAHDGDGHVGVSSALAIEAPPDVDGDGLPDPWELRYFDSLTAPDGGPNDDADGDGVSNRDEFLAGTNPRDAASRFRLLAELSGDDVRLRLPTQPGRTYRVERTDSLSENAVWEVVSGAASLPGTGAILEVIDTQAASRPQCFYRARIH